MSVPIRIRWDKLKSIPENSVYVGNAATKYGNPFEMGLSYSIDKELQTVLTPEQATEYYKRWAIENREQFPQWWEQTIRELKGKNLVCDCELSEPCHADFLLEIANEK
jgi:hypothetical protein